MLTLTHHVPCKSSKLTLIKMKNGNILVKMTLVCYTFTDLSIKSFKCFFLLASLSLLISINYYALYNALKSKQTQIRSTCHSKLHQEKPKKVVYYTEDKSPFKTLEIISNIGNRSRSPHLKDNISRSAIHQTKKLRACSFYDPLINKVFGSILKINSPKQILTFYNNCIKCIVLRHF